MAASRRPQPRGNRPGNNRPAPRAGAARTRGGQRVSPRPRFTNRAVILVLVFGVLVISYASSMRAYLDQRAHIAGLEEQIAQSRQEIAEGEREKRRWNDDAYIAAEARERFGWVFPGETSYVVLDRNGRPLTGDDSLTDPSLVAAETPQAWWSKAYGTLEVADHPERSVKPKPVTRITPPPRPES